MPEVDTSKCVLHGEKLSQVEKRMETIEKKLFGNGQKGLASLAEANAIWLKVVAIMCGTMLAALVPVFFKVMFKV